MWSCNPVCVLNYTQSPSSRHWDLHQIPLGDVGTFLTQHYSIIPTMCGFFPPLQCWVFPAWTVENPAEDTQLHIISTRLHWQLGRVQQPVKPVAFYLFYKCPIGGEKAWLCLVVVAMWFGKSVVFDKLAFCIIWCPQMGVFANNTLTWSTSAGLVDQMDITFVLVMYWSIFILFSFETKVNIQSAVLTCGLPQYLYRKIQVTTKAYGSGTTLTC